MNLHPDPHPHRMMRTRRLAGLVLALLLSACSDSPSAAGGCGRTLRLDVGEAADVEPTAECPLRTEGGAEYVLAYYDAQPAIGAQTQPEPYYLDQRFAIAAEDVTGGARTSVASPSKNGPAAAGDGDFRLSTAAGGSAHLRGFPDTGPWAVGDAVSYRRTECSTTSCEPLLEARVVRVFDGWLVFAVAPSLGADAARVVELFDQYAPVLRQHGLPLMHAAFAVERPVSSAQSGQLVMVMEGDVTGVDGNAYSEVRLEGTATHWVRLEASPQLDGGAMLSLMAHEIAHTFQTEFLARTPPLSGDRGARGAARWGIEGGAALVESETLRRAAGLPLQGNLDYGVTPRSELESWVYRHAGTRDASLAVGYHSTAPFLRDLAMRRVAAGDGVEVAFREVLRGAVEGWYGVAVEGARRPGLTERMRARFSGWEPVDGVLTWALSAAADDRVANSIYQDRTWLQTGDWERRGRGWAYDLLVQAGSGASQRVTRHVGSAGYLLIRAPSGRVELALTAPESVRWKLLRVS
jgi:hypothetical protein